MQVVNVVGPKSPETLKVLVACYESKIDAKFCEGSTLNVTFKNGDSLFSSNAALRCVFEMAKRKEVSGFEAGLLEWELVCLRKLVAQFCSGSKSLAQDKTFVKVLSDLESFVDKLKENNLASCLILSSLHPVVQSAAEFSEKFPKLSAWHNAFTSKDSFKKASKLVESKTDGKFQSYFALLPKSTSKPTVLPLSAIVTEQTEDANTIVKVEVKISPEELEATRSAWNSTDRPLPKKREHPILPKENERNVLITSALPYVNNVPHLGNIIGCVLSADVFSRYCRLRQWNTLYISGTDEYGTATETKAAQEGVTPQEICDKYNKLHSEVYDWFKIDFDYFGRTTTQQQTEIAQDIFWRLYKNGHLEQQTVEQLHCSKCDRFLADRFVEGTCPLCDYEDARGDQCDKCGKLINATELKKPKCKMCSDTPSVRNSEHLFIDLSKLEPKLRETLAKSFEGQGWSSNAKTITEAWLRDGIKPRCITRDLKWGTPVPLEGFTDKVFYVWFDAPIGYISITANYTKDWAQWWKNPKNVEMFNFMAKDNVPFHSVVFPCTLLGADDNYTTLSHLNATEYLNYEDAKFSKSRGIGVFGDQAGSTDIDPDIWRFYLLFMRPEGQDTQFSWSDFLTKNNSELLNNLGNFINRSLKFVKNMYDGKVPECQLTSVDLELMCLVNRELKAYVEDMKSIRLRDNLKRVLTISRLGNQYLQENQPWKKIKGDENDKIRAATVTCVASNLSCLLSVLVQPYMPVTSGVIQGQMNAPPGVNVLGDTPRLTQMLPTGHRINEPAPLFRKLDEAEMAGYKAKFGGKQSTESPQNAAPAPDVQPTNPAAKRAVDATGDAAGLEAEVAKQGDVVRSLKTNKGEKSDIDREVAKLLELKKKLAILKGEDVNAKPSKKSKKKSKK